jgi:putative hydrolase of the HAD superfamily
MNQPPKNIKAILFDLDGTLRHHLPRGGQVFVQYLKSLHIHISEEAETRAERWEHFYFAHSLEIRKDIETFKSNTKEFWINYSKRRLVALGLSPQHAAELAPEVSAHMGTNYKPEVYVPEEAPLILTSLKEAGYTLGVVSNRDEPFHEELKELKLASYFEFSLAGGEVQSFKPDTRIFEKGLELANAAAHEAVYIGDNYYADIVGSLRAGLTPVLYDPNTLFPDAGCAVIQSFTDLPDLLK